MFVCLCLCECVSVCKRTSPAKHEYPTRVQCWLQYEHQCTYLVSYGCISAAVHGAMELGPWCPSDGAALGVARAPSKPHSQKCFPGFQGVERLQKTESCIQSYVGYCGVPQMLSSVDLHS